MKKITLIGAIIASLALPACQTEEAANDKLEGCIEDEFGEDSVEGMMKQFEVSCDEYDSEEDCDKCIECVIDTDCEALLDGDCADQCV